MYISLSAFSFTEVAKALVTAGASLAAISEKKYIINLKSENMIKFSTVGG